MSGLVAEVHEGVAASDEGVEEELIELEGAREAVDGLLKAVQPATGEG